MSWSVLFLTVPLTHLLVNPGSESVNRSDAVKQLLLISSGVISTGPHQYVLKINSKSLGLCLGLYCRFCERKLIC